MSRWWPERLRIELGPERVVGVRLPRAWTRSPGARWETPLAPAESQPQWTEALEALHAGLDALGRSQRAILDVRLSNRFVRYALVPWSDDLRSEAEVAAFARHRMRETYGDMAQAWEIRLGAGWPGAPRVAAAVDRELVEDLAALARNRGLRLGLVEPLFAAVVDAHRRQLRGQAFWLAVHESSRIVLARAAGGEWRTLVAARVTGQPAPILAAMLTRETLALPESELPRRLYLHGLDAGQGGPLAAAGWDIVWLQERAAAGEALAA